MGTFTGLSLVITSQSKHIWQLFLTYSLLLSLGTGAIYTVVNSTSSRWFVKKRGFVVGITSSGGGAGAIAVAPFATFLISHFNWRTAFILLGFISWILMSGASLLLKKDPSDMGLLPDGIKSATPQTDNIKKGNRLQPEELSLKKASHLSQFWIIGSIWLLLSLSVHMIFVHLVPYAVEMGVSPMHAALILSFIGLASILGRVIVGYLSDAMDGKTLGTGCALIQFGSLLWFLYARDLWMLYFFAIAFGILWGGVSIVITTLVGDIFGVNSLGAIMGMMVAWWSLGAAAGPAIAAYIFDVSGHYFAAFAAGAGALFIATILLAILRKAPHRHVHKTPIP